MASDIDDIVNWKIPSDMPIDEVVIAVQEKLGGMAKAIETGIPKMKIEQAAARKQARIDNGNDIMHYQISL